MKIIKNGKRNCGAFKFKCDKCGCKFEADTNDYVYVRFDDSPPPDYGFHPTENNTPSDTIECKCPNCGSEVIKCVYEKADNSPFGTLFRVMTTVNAALILLILCTIPKKAEGMSGFQIFVEVLLIILALINSIIYMIVWAES